MKHYLRLSVFICGFILVSSFILQPSSFAALTIESGPASNITRVAADIYGNLSATNGSTNTVNVLLYYGTSDGTTNGSSWGYSNAYGIVTNTGILATNLSSLTPATRHYYRWYVFEGTNFDWAGGTSNFTTTAGAPTNQPAASNVTLMVSSNGTLRSPTNFFGANTGLMDAAGVAMDSETAVLVQSWTAGTGITNAGTATNPTGALNAASVASLLLADSATQPSDDWTNTVAGMSAGNVTNGAARGATALQAEADTNALAQLSGHTNATGTAAHGLGDISTRGSNDFYLASNPSSYVDATVTNAHAALTGTSVHGLGDISTRGSNDFYLASNPSSYVDATVTNAHAALTGTAAHGLGDISTRGSNDFYLASNPSEYINTNLAGGSLVNLGGALPQSDNAMDLGSDSLSWQNMFLKSTMRFRSPTIPAGSMSVGISPASESDKIIWDSTTNGDSRLIIVGGCEDLTGSGYRGSHIWLYGSNRVVTAEGRVLAGSIAIGSTNFIRIMLDWDLDGMTENMIYIDKDGIRPSSNTIPCALGSAAVPWPAVYADNVFHGTAGTNYLYYLNSTNYVAQWADVSAYYLQAVSNGTASAVKTNALW